MRPKLTLVPPKPGRTCFYTVRGSYRGVTVHQSTRSADKRVSEQILKAIKEDIDRRAAAPADSGPTFVSAVESYLAHKGDLAAHNRKFIAAIVTYFGPRKLVSEIDQHTIDRAALALLPDAAAATRNREVYTPISAILRHNNVPLTLKRPQGAQGGRRELWLREDEAIRFLNAAWDHHPRFGAFCSFLLYTGCRISEALRLRTESLDLENSYAEVRKTKNGSPRGVYLPPALVAALRRCLMEKVNPSYKAPTQPREGSVFALTKSGHLYTMLTEVEAKSKVNLPPGTAFHVFRHTYGAMMRRYGRVQLHETRAWTSRAGAKPYDHYDVTDAARAADKLPGAMNGTVPGLKEVKEV